MVAVGLLSWVGLPPELQPVHVFRSVPPTCTSASTVAARPATRFQFAALAPCRSAQGENTRGQAQGPVEIPRDDAQQIANFEDLILREEFHEVEPLLRHYLESHPQSWRAHYFLGYVCLRLHRIGDSVRALAKSLELNTNNAEAHKLLGRNLSIIGRYDLAIVEFQRALHLNPLSAEVHYDWGRVHAIQDDFAGARNEFEAAIRLSPNYVEAHNALGFALEALGDDAGALEAYQTAVRINEERQSKFEAPYVNLSGYYNRRGRLDLAVEYAHKALAMNPKSDLAHFQIAKACRTREDWQGVAEALEKAVELKPSTSKYYYVLATAYRKLGKIEESERAMATFRQIEKQTAELEGQRREARRATFDFQPSPEKDE